MKAILKYPGSKWRIARWIIENMPAHHSYIEPYFGSGAVFFNKNPSNIETINDLDGEVINFFEVVRDNPEELSAKIYMTPYARAVYENIYEQPYKVTDTKLDKALKFCIKINMSHGYRCNSKVGWKNDVQGRERAYALRSWNRIPDIIMEAAVRLKETQIEHRSAVEVIQRFNNPKCLIYCDPPYVLETRSKSTKQYNFEMSNKDHEDLLNTVLDSKSKIIMSGYESDLYNDALKGWRKKTGYSLTQSLRKAKEVLWMNFGEEIICN